MVNNDGRTLTTFLTLVGMFEQAYENDDGEIGEAVEQLADVSVPVFGTRMTTMARHYAEVEWVVNNE